MPIFNGEKYIHYSLRSIQNQKMKNIEIILIDDCSTDNSLIKIEKYMNEDKRIKLIKNNKHRKILYSKSIASLNANGKYIIELDQDDIFIREDVFDILYSEAEKNNIDLVQIRDFVKENFFFRRVTKVNDLNMHYIFPQPTHYKKHKELKDKMFIENNNYLLWGLLILTNLYKKAVYKIWPIIMNYQIIFNEDYIITFMIIILSKHYKYLNEFALIHLIHSKSATIVNWKNNEFYISILFYANFIYNYYIKFNPKEIKLLINFINFYSEHFKIAAKLYPTFFNHIIEFIFHNKYISLSYKKYLTNKLSLNAEIYNFWNNSTYLITQSQFKDFGNIKFSNNTMKSTIYRTPIFSIIIIYNDFQTFEKTIESIKKQNFNNYEIIVIYNFDEKLDVLPKNDNWKIISNKSKKGLIYLYSIGILASKGNYILTLQSGYILFQINALYNIYQISKENNFDIYEFNLLINNTEQIKKDSLILYKCGHLETNIDLKIIKTNDNYIDIYKNEEILSNKLIESKFFKNLINKYKLYQYNKNIYNYFEKIFLFILFTKDIKFKHNDIIGLIIYIKDFNRIQNVDKSKMRDSIPYINFLFDNTDNSFNGKQLALNEFINHLSEIYNKFTLVSSEAHQLLKKFLNCEYIRLEDKNELNFYYKSLIN
jgi:glycosyltransferase involved in cell wall biosynthesis